MACSFCWSVMLCENRYPLFCIMLLARGDQRPEIIGAARGDEVAERDRPMALVAEVVAPGEQSQGEAVQDVLFGKSNRAMHLMGDRDALLRRLGAPDFRCGGFEE